MRKTLVFGEDLCSGGVEVAGGFQAGHARQRDGRLHDAREGGCLQ